jgi:hypothetical protein
VKGVECPEGQKDFCEGCDEDEKGEHGYHAK